MSKQELEKEIDNIRYILSVTKNNPSEQRFWSIIYYETYDELSEAKNE